MGSPRAAACFDFSDSALEHKVTEADNRPGVGRSFPSSSSEALKNADLYAVEKELYLGSLCEVPDTPQPWQFWTVMLKNGNFDTRSGLCPENGKKVGPFPQTGRFPCFGNGCMNQPLFYHQLTLLSEDGKTRGGFNGSYDLGGNFRSGSDNLSYFEVVWEKSVGIGSWVFNHKVRTTKNYPWLMLYVMQPKDSLVGTIIKQEFLLRSAHIMKQPLFKQACTAAFYGCDEEGKGYITKQQLGDAIHSAMPSMNDDNVSELFNLFDSDNDGAISSDDFMACLRRNPLLVALFASNSMHCGLIEGGKLVIE